MSSDQSNVEKTLDERITQLINDRPYYICKVYDIHTDLQSQLGSIDAAYSREHDRLNEEYLLREIKSLIASEVKKARIDEVSIIPPMFGPYKEQRLATLTQEKS